MTRLPMVLLRQRGVTLLELLIVLSIMAFVATIVLPMLGGGGVSTSELKSAATGSRTELTYEPFAWPSIPAMVHAGLGRDLGTQNFLGRAAISQVFGVSPDLSVTRPPTGALDDQSLRALGRSTSVVLAQPDTVARPAQTNDFAPPPTA